MSLDTRIRAAVDESVRSPVDLEAGLVALRRTRRHRAAALLGACATVVALVLAGVFLGRHDSQPEPAPAPGQVKNGVVLTLSLGGRLVQTGQEGLTTLPARIEPFGPFSFTFDGRSLVYASRGLIRSVDLETGETTPLMVCPNRDCLGAVNRTATALATGGRRITVRDLHSGHVVRYHVGSASPVAWSPDGHSLELIAGSRDWVERFDLDTGDLTRLVALGKGAISIPAWSPDGSTFAYIKAQPRHDKPPLYTLMTVPATGGRPQVVHPIGACYCIRYEPAVGWSPDGRRIAVTLAGIPHPDQVGGALYTVRPDGSDWRLYAAGHFQDRIAWQPVISPHD